jgi:uncharacterized membrane protein AbrB (regulator of aidB expression)
MKNTTLQETTAALALVVLLALILNPYEIWMPSMAHMMIVTALLVVFGFFTSVVLREQANDERESAHRMYAGRAAFLTGSLLLIAAISYQSLSHQQLDTWLPVILVAMVLAKIGTRLYSDRFL